MEKRDFFTDAQLLEIISAHMEAITPDDVIDLMNDSIDAVEKRDTCGALKKAPPVEKMVLMIQEIYKRGFASGLMVYNETVKAQVQQMA